MMTHPEGSPSSNASVSRRSFLSTLGAGAAAVALGAQAVAATATSAIAAEAPKPAAAPAPAAGAGKTVIKYHGHSAFSLTTPSGKVLYIDPWLKNPINTTADADLAAAKTKADGILISHGHFDHVGQAPEIGIAAGAPLTCMLELGLALVTHFGYPKDKATYATLANLGGSTPLLDGEVTVTLVPAWHSSSLTVPEAGEPADSSKTRDIIAGSPTGLVIAIKGGPTIYHTGDTDVFSDMSLIAQMYKPTILMACIGDHFTMGPKGAALATKLIAPKIVIPTHYGTFPVLPGTPELFEKELKAAGALARLKVMKPGETLEA
ncbi:MAG: metal-dependent hydrolase [Candidatus Methylacidiphilales bacterium]|nr:metal-dependent hydrolase [Candidatus Methylacidiphilales bacterium]